MTEEAYNDFRSGFENLLNKYRDVVQDDFYFEKLADYSSDTLCKTEHSLRKNLIEMYCGLLNTVREWEAKGYTDDKGYKENA